MKKVILGTSLLAIMLAISAPSSQASLDSSPVGKNQPMMDSPFSTLQVIYYQINQQVAQVYIQNNRSLALPPGGLNTFCRMPKLQSFAENLTGAAAQQVTRGLEKQALSNTYFIRLNHDKKQPSQVVSRTQAQKDLNGLTQNIHVHSSDTSMELCQKDVIHQQVQAFSKEKQ